MRHINYYNRYYSRKGKVFIDKPYLYRSWTFANPHHKHGYVKILQCLLGNPGLRRRELHEKVFKRRYFSGNRSCLYAVMLWADLIDYDKKFRYFITPKGRKLLKKSYMNDLALCYGTSANAIESFLKETT